MSSAKTKKKVLLVEDDKALNDAFFLVLKDKYEVERALNGKEALELTQTNNFDLILLDLLMPVMDGKEFLRQYEKNDATKVIVFSNLDTQTDINEVQELGTDRYLLKSWASPTELTRIIEETLN